MITGLKEKSYTKEEFVSMSSDHTDPPQTTLLLRCGPCKRVSRILNCMPFVHRRSCNQTDAVYFLCPKTGNGGTKPCRRKIMCRRFWTSSTSVCPRQSWTEKLSDYHENDLADALTVLTPEERQKVYTALGVDTVAEIFSYLDDAEPYLKELDPERAARVTSPIDSEFVPKKGGPPLF